MTPVTDISHRKRFFAKGNAYLPHIAVIEKIIDETYDTYLPLKFSIFIKALILIFPNFLMLYQHNG